MKIYKLNSFSTFLMSLFIIGLVIFLPIFLIEFLWNSTLGKTYDYLLINTWQALILWLIVLTLLNILGIFKFEFAVEKIDKEHLKNKLEEITSKSEETKKDNTNDSKGNNNNNA